MTQLKGITYEGGHPELSKKVLGNLRLTPVALEFNQVWSTYVLFRVPMSSITAVRYDTSENITLGRMVLLGLGAFAFKKKTYYLVIDYKSSSGTDYQVVFETGSNKDLAFLNQLNRKRDQTKTKENHSVSESIQPVITKQPTREKRSIAVGTPESLMKRGYLFLEDGDFDDARDYFDTVLDIDPENHKAYFGKLLAELRLKQTEDIVKHSESLKKYKDFEKAVRFAPDELRIQYEHYNQVIESRLEEEKAERESLRERVMAREAKRLEEERKKKKILEEEKRAREEKERIEKERIIEQQRIKHAATNKRIMKALLVCTLIALIGFGAFLTEFKFSASGYYNRIDQYGQNQLMREIERRNVGAATKVIDHTQDLEQKNIYGNNALMLAINKEMENLALRLIDDMPDLQQRNNAGETALSLAINRGVDNVVNHIVKRSSDIQDHAEINRVLDYALITSNNDILSTLIETGWIELFKGEVVQAAAGTNHTILLANDGEVYSFGDGSLAQLGHGNEESKLIPVRIEGLDPIKAIAAGRVHSVLLTEEGRVYAFGNGWSGQLGLGDNSHRLSPEIVEGIDLIKDIEAGRDHTILLTESGSVYTFGEGRSGQLGHGDGASKLVPEKLEGIEPIRNIAAGDYHSILLTEQGTVYSFGFGDFGQLGHGDTDSKLIPKRVEGIEPIKAVTAGSNHTILLTEEGKVYAFGHGWNGQLGHGDDRHKFSPEIIEGIDLIKDIEAGINHTILLTEEGSVYTFGEGLSGQLGHGDGESKSVPEKLEGVEPIRNIAAGDYHNILLSEQGTVYSFGFGLKGQLGHGNKESKLHPERIETIFRMVPSGYVSQLTEQPAVSEQPEQEKTPNVNNSVKVTPQTNTDQAGFEERVWKYCMDRWAYYDALEGGYAGDKYTDQVFRDAAQRFNISATEAYQIWDRVDKRKLGI